MTNYEVQALLTDVPLEKENPHAVIVVSDSGSPNASEHRCPALFRCVYVELSV
jgi:hypothetical protein